jgi:RNA polymerase sigma-70 factor (ECF subfamily)
MTYGKKIEYYQQLLSRHRGLIFRACRIYGNGDVDFMRDLFQEVSMALWESLENFQHRSEESTCVWNVARKTVLYHLRKKKVETAVIQTGLTDEMHEKPAEDDTAIEELYTAIAQLETDDQLLVTLRLDGKSYSEIALQLGTNEGALRTRYTRIVKQLRKLMVA